VAVQPLDELLDALFDASDVRVIGHAGRSSTQ
jgi:hypothetical protein